MHIRSLLADNAGLSRIILPLLEAWRSLRLQAARLGKQLLAEARRNQQCQLLMSIPGVGAITATAYLNNEKAGREAVVFASGRHHELHDGNDGGRGREAEITAKLSGLALPLSLPGDYSMKIESLIKRKDGTKARTWPKSTCKATLTPSCA